MLFKPIIFYVFTNSRRLERSKSRARRTALSKVEKLPLGRGGGGVSTKPLPSPGLDAKCTKKDRTEFSVGLADDSFGRTESKEIRTIVGLVGTGRQLSFFVREPNCFMIRRWTPVLLLWSSSVNGKYIGKTIDRGLAAGDTLRPAVYTLLIRHYVRSRMISIMYWNTYTYKSYININLRIISTSERAITARRAV